MLISLDEAVDRVLACVSPAPLEDVPLLEALGRTLASDLVSPEAVKHFQGLVPHAAYSDIANATHMVVGDQNDAFGQSIVNFLLRTHGSELKS